MTASESEAEGGGLVGFAQGDVVTIPYLPLAGNSPPKPMSQGGAVVISQTCDLVQDSKLTATLAELTYLSDTAAREARNGQRPGYVHVPLMGENAFADLDCVATIPKTELAKLARIPGVDAARDDQVRDFGKRVGRRYSRFAFPDNVTPWLRPLQRLVQSKALRPASPLGAQLEGVTELRLECLNGWHVEPHDLNLIVVVTPGLVPEPDFEAFPPDESLVEWCRARNSNQIAERMSQTTHPTNLATLWQELASSFARECNPDDDAEDKVKNAVRSITAEVSPEDELSYSRVLRSVEIDLEHLSPTWPSP